MAAATETRWAARLERWPAHIAFLLALAILGVIGASSYFSLQGLVEAQGQVQHSHEVIDDLKDLTAEVTEVESSARGFVLAGKDTYLDPYFAAVERVSKALHRLRHATEGAPEEVARMTAIESRVAEKLGYHQRMIELRRNLRADAPLEIFLTGRGQELMSEIRATTEKMVAEQMASLTSWSLDAQHHSRWSRYAIVVGFALSFSILAAVYYKLLRENRSRRRSEQRLIHLNRLYATLSRVGQTVITVRDRATLWQEVCRIAVAEGGFRMAWIGVPEQDGKRIAPVCHWGHEEGYLSKLAISLPDPVRGYGPTASAVRTGIRFICNDIAQDVRMLPWRESALSRGYRSSAAFPIFVDGRAAAVFSVYASEPGFFDEEINALFDEIVSNVGFSLENMDREAQRIAAERRLRESEERFRQMAENIEEMLWITDADFTRMLYVSPAYERISGRSCRSLYERPDSFIEAIHPEERAAVERDIAATVAARKEWNREYRMVRPDGSVRWVWDRAFTVRGEEGEMVGWAGISQDVTERRIAEQALRDMNQELERRVQQRTAELAEANRNLSERNAAVEKASRYKSEFLARVSHEFRTPLNAIVGYSDLLCEETAGPLNDSYRRFVRNVQDGAQHLTELVNDLLDLSRIEAGRIELSLERVEVAAALKEVLSVIAPLAETRNLTVDNCVSPGVEAVADRVRFKQILYNLVSNAVKFTPGGGRVWVEAETRGELLSVSVSDTGIGIAGEDQKSIFEEFRQIASGNQPAPGGVGLGLAITRKLAELHGGMVSVRSERGKGSRFTVTLPAFRAADVARGETMHA
jgi:PAS domain S-box-containing protein